jgi:hypothetical protein
LNMHATGKALDSLLTDRSLQAKKVVNYAESSEDEEPIVRGPASRNRRRNTARRVVKDEDEYGEEDDDVALLDDDGTLALVADSVSGVDLSNRRHG